MKQTKTELQKEEYVTLVLNNLVKEAEEVRARMVRNMNALDTMLYEIAWADDKIVTIECGSIANQVLESAKQNGSLFVAMVTFEKRLKEALLKNSLRGTSSSQCSNAVTNQTREAWCRMYEKLDAMIKDWAADA